MKHRRLFALLALFACMLSIAACGDDDDEPTAGDSGSQTTEAAASGIESNPDNGKVTLTVGSKNFTEQKVLGEVYAQGLAAAGYKVRKELNLGDEKTAQTSLKQG